MAKGSKEARTFDTSTVAGLKRAERYQQRLYSKYEHVSVRSTGLDCVTILGWSAKPSKPGPEFRPELLGLGSHG